MEEKKKEKKKGGGKKKKENPNICLEFEQISWFFILKLNNKKVIQHGSTILITKKIINEATNWNSEIAFQIWLVVLDIAWVKLALMHEPFCLQIRCSRSAWDCIELRLKPKSMYSYSFMTYFIHLYTICM